ncbi:MAG: endolytic transglycosylase MltG [Alphaproteobacteria bacterium]|nr:endolytic transglycosylase MltG [Alphaproteobacteria bacterium]
MSDEEPITRVSEPEIPRRRRPVLLRLLGRALLWLVILSVVAGGALGWGWLNFTAPGPLTANKVVNLPKGADRATIAAALKDQGVISDIRLFSGAAALDEALRHARLKPGEYEFPASASMEDVLAIVISGRFLTYKVTIPEGWTSQMVVNRLMEHEEMDGAVSKVPDEGALLPDTYIVTRGYPRDKLLAEMAAAQTKLLDQEWPRLSADSPIKTKNDLVTLASIVEKETGVAEERPMVASVFLNRLVAKMRLQSDPTVIYGLVGGKGKLDHAITRDELDQQTPYNTYQIDGLPPGPIANPGKAAIEAVLNPAKSTYLYFVANGSGGHAFATTLDEHNANVKKWRALNGDGDATPAATPAQKPAAAAPAAAAPAPAPAATTADPKPGTTVIINGKKVPIPLLKKKVP